MKPAQMNVAGGERRIPGQLALDLKISLLAVAILDVRVNTCDVRFRQERRRLRGERIGKKGSARLRRRKLHDDVLRAVALQSIRGRAKGNAVEVDSEARAHHRLVVSGRVGEADARGKVVRVCLNRVGQKLRVVAKTRVQSQTGARSPLILHEESYVRIRLKLLG